MSERFNVLVCKFYKFYTRAVVGVIVEKHRDLTAFIFSLLPGMGLVQY